MHWNYYFWVTSSWLGDILAQDLTNIQVLHTLPFLEVFIFEAFASYHLDPP